MILALVDLLSSFWQAGNMEQMETISRSMLMAMPDDIVALQFLGLALYQTGRIDDAYKMFKRVAAKFDDQTAMTRPTTCEPAAVVSYREAIRLDSGLAEGWHKIAQILKKFGFRKAAIRAYDAALTARGRRAVKLHLSCNKDVIAAMPLVLCRRLD